MPLTQRDEAFIKLLEKLRDSEDRAALANLRRGFGQYPGAEPKMYRYVEPFLPDERSRKTEYIYYLIAALFAFHSQPEGNGNMGSHFAQTLTPEVENTATERRFEALLAVRFNDLHLHLRQAVSFLKSKDVPINWQQLLTDLFGWNSRRYSVQHQWASRFWRQAAQLQTGTK